MSQRGDSDLPIVRGQERGRPGASLASCMLICIRQHPPPERASRPLSSPRSLASPDLKRADTPQRRHHRRAAVPIVPTPRVGSPHPALALASTGARGPGACREDSSTTSRSPRGGDLGLEEPCRPRQVRPRGYGTGSVNNTKALLFGPIAVVSLDLRSSFLLLPFGLLSTRRRRQARAFVQAEADEQTDGELACYRHLFLHNMQWRAPAPHLLLLHTLRSTTLQPHDPDLPLPLASLPPLLSSL